MLSEKNSVCLMVIAEKPKNQNADLAKFCDFHELRYLNQFSTDAFLLGLFGVRVGRPTFFLKAMFLNILKLDLELTDSTIYVCNPIS